ncbi:MAG: hypothetical protein HFJ57_02320 [Clostridia bacterium]|nr:hypothetical protein [Clostridia bacterium]
MDYSVVINMVVEIIKICFPIALIFGITGKIVNFALDMILNRRIEL